MKNILFSLSFLLAACNYVAHEKPGQADVPKDSKTQKINLTGIGGSVTLSLPLRYDTTFSWIYYSDCGKACERRKYRFQPEALPIYQETGFHYKQLKDSIDQFTIVHSPYLISGFFDNPDDKIFMMSFHDHKKWNIIHDPELLQINSDSIEKIGDRYFSIIVIEKYDTATAEYSKELLSSTTFKNGTIDFNFKLLTKRKDSLTENFIANAKSYLRTIRFESTNKKN
jgi:hypothetical protein